MDKEFMQFRANYKPLTLLDLLSANGHFRRVATTNGGEWAGPCPFCGGRDRFRVWPNQDNGRFWCRGCGRHGDAIDYLREVRGLSFQEACRELGVDPHREREHRPAGETFSPRESTTPGDLWQRKAGAFLERAQRALSGNRKILDFLHGRGLRDGTIRAAGLGWNPRGQYENRKAWGLDPVKDEEGKGKKLWLPAGLVIPFQVDGAVLRLRIRRPDPGDGPRYVIVSGSYTGPMTWGLDKETLCIVESEIDGLLIDQEARNLAGVISLGSAQAKPDEKTDRILRQCQLILVSLDFDEAGGKAAWQFWLTTYPNARRWPVPIGKDPSEAFQRGLCIKPWIEAALIIKPSSEQREKAKEAEIRPFPKEWLQRFDEAQLERLAIMTVDGRLSDQEAIALLNLECLSEKEWGK